MAGVSEELTLRMRSEGSRQFTADREAEARSVRHVGTEAEKSGRKMQRAGDRMQRMGRTMQRTGKSMTRNVSTPIVGAGVVAAKFAVDFDKQMRRVNSIAQLSEPQFQDLSKQVLALAGPTAQAPSKLAEGMNDLIQSGYGTQDALKLLTVSSRSATAGMTDAGTATSAIVSILKTYGKGVDQAQKVSDVLFKTVDIGRISYEDLSQEIGRVLQPAAAVGVTIEQLGGAYGVLTNRGFSAVTATTGLTQILSQLTKPSKNLSEQFDEIGVKSGPEAIKKFGSMQGVMQALYKSVGGNQLAFQNLFRGQQAGGAAFTMVGRNADDANEALKGVSDSAGSTDKAMSQIEKSQAYKWQKLMSQLQADAIQLGDVVLPILSKMTDYVTKTVDAFKGLPKGMQKAIGAAVAAAAVAGPALWAGGKVASVGGRLLGRGGRRGGGGLGGLAGRAGVVPVYVTNEGFGGMGGMPGKGGRLGKTSRTGRLVRGAGKVALPVAAGVAIHQAAMQTGLKRYSGKKGWGNLWRDTKKFAGSGSKGRYVTGMGGRQYVGPSQTTLNTQAYAGYKGIPTAASARQDSKAVAHAAAVAAAGAVHRASGERVTVVNIDGKEVARVVHRRAVKDKSRR